jgi:hypothetical protein
MKTYGATSGRSTKDSLKNLAGELVALSLLLSANAVATPPPGGVAPVLTPAGGFIIDGRLAAGASGPGDWLGTTNAGSGVLNSAGVPLNPATTFHFVDPYSSSSDTTFVGGLKWTDDPNIWQWTTSKASSKTDINNVLLHIATDAAGHTWTIVAADRASTSGDSYIDFEFLQNTLIRNSNGSFSTIKTNGGRTVNDLLLSLAFTSGGSVADFLAYRWLPDGSGGYAYVDVTASLPAGKVFVALNSNSIAVPYGAFGSTTYAPNAFADAALDLTALFGGFDPCLSVGFKTIMVKTKSSPSSTATISDFIDPIQYSLRIGPSANAGADQVRCTQGDSTDFPLQGQASAGMQPIASTTWSVISGTATIDSPASLQTTAHVSSVAATLRLTVLESNGCVETDDVVLTVANLPGCSITGANLMCPNSTNVFQAPASMTGYSWSISGNGSISGATNAQTVKVVGGNACGVTFTLSLTTTSGICSTFCSTDIMVADVTPPTIVVPPDRILECPANTSTNATGVATAQDDCGAVSVSYSDTLTANCGNTKVIARNWIAVDHCGNATNAIQLITVRDTTPPSLSLPPNLTLECPANTNTSNTGFATAQDGCSAVTVGFTDSVSNNCGGTAVIRRLWVATDACGNATNGVQIITIRDSTAPSLIIPQSLTLECPADSSTNNTGVAISQDGCGAVTLTYSDVVSNTCGGGYVTRRTWTASDSCGNTTNGVQVITIRDTTRPVLTLPPNLALECPADTSTTNTGFATATDTCSSVQVTFTDSVTTNCGGTRVIARKWTATDACGNSTNATQTISVIDSTAPGLIRPPDLVLECPANTSTNNTGVAIAHDGCSAATVSYSDIVTTNCGGTRVIARTWTARDTCGNITNAVQMITVRDSTPPSIICPANVTLECPGNTNVSNTGIATAQDGCGTVIVNFSDSVSNSCGGARSIARTWTATDACGNSTNATQIIIVRDTTPPTLALPANLVLECPANTNTSNTGVASSQDGCGSVTIGFSDSISNSCGGTATIRRLWTATDSCGNSTNGIQTITIRDTKAPTLSIPPNLTLECPANTSTNNTGVAMAQDGCSAAVVSYSDIVTTNCGNTKVIARTWTAADSCGNYTNATQTITVRDSTPPSLTLPLNLTLECPANTNISNTGSATAQDGCGSVTVTFSDSVSNTCGGAKIIRRLWTAVDQCGNSTNGMQTITVRDTTAPVLTVPVDVVLECPSTNTSTNYTGVATATDGCSLTTVTYNDVVTTNCGQTKVIVRTWTASDQCGNSTSVAQKITIRDTLKPSLTIPANVVLECPANTSTTNTGVATATDGCSKVTVIYSDSISNSCGGAKVISRLWTATDDCGNSTNKIQLITIVDTHPPTITAPPNLVLDCPANTGTNYTGYPVAQDGCSSVIISYSDVVSNYCGGTKFITRTWTAADPCGNAASAVQTITIRDITPPALRMPANLVLQCPGDTRTNVTGVAIATDGCGAVTLSYSDVVSNSCGLTRTVQRLWTAVDQCGNTTNGLQTITVVDTTKPSVTCPNPSYQCAGDVPPAYTNLAAFLAAGGTASDPCSTALAFALISDSGLVGRCPGAVTRVYRFTDDCGNYSDVTQRITVNDTIAPVLTCPTNSTVEYGLSLNPTNTGRATATDNCSTNVTLTYSDSTVDSSYSVNFYAADPDTGTGPYSPTYVKLGPASLSCPNDAILTGRSPDPLRNAVAFGPTSSTLDALTSMGGAPMCLGQIVPFEAVITMGGGPGPERGTIDFSASWATYTTSNDHFGFDTNYMVYCAFVDTADPGLIDPNKNARVESYSSTLINQGTINEQIVGTFRVSGIDVGDQIVVEIWMVLDSTQSGNAGGTIASQLVSAQKVLNPPVPITVGSKTISIGNLNKMNPLPPPQQQPPPIPPTQQASVPPGALVSVIERTWTATDDCGNSSVCVQQISVRDTSIPSFNVPPNLVLNCPADTSTNTTGVATATDAGGPVLIYYTDSVTNLCGGTKVVSRLWTAIDQAGNTTNALQTITVQDITPPSLVCPANVTLECPGDISTNNCGVAAAQDGCGAVTLTYADTVAVNCANTKVITRKWTATDACGNSTNANQTITVRDTTPPSIAAPPSIVLDCPADTSTNNTGTASAHDGCGSVTITYNDLVISNCANTRVVTRTWTATDACGNATNAIQTITVRDITPPTMVCPPNLTIQCSADTSTNHCGSATAQDGCGQVQVSYKDTSVTNGPVMTIYRAWTATDTCGNATNSVQTLTVVKDTIPPTLTIVPGVKMTSFSDTWGFGTPVATDNCGYVTVSVLNTTTNVTTTNTVVICRTWVATDAALNTNTCCQTIILQLGPAPTISSQPHGQTFGNGDSGKINIGVSGNGPFTYQWRRNGINISGATNGTLNLSALQYTNAGLYTVVVTYNGLSTTSAVSVVNVAPRLHSSVSAKTMTLTWSGPFTLQSASRVNGPWTDVRVVVTNQLGTRVAAQSVPAQSPFSVSMADRQKFFRLRSDPAMIALKRTNGLFNVSLTGPVGENYIIQASTNLTQWVNLQTNTLPTSLIDPAAPQYRNRFYRAMLAH